MATDYTKVNLGQDLSKVPVYDTDPDKQQQIIDQTQQLYNELERRNNAPNYFKMAAAFAKPQLGGFFASLGNAAGVLGEQEEEQKKLAIPIAQARAQLGIQQMNLAQRQKGADLVKKGAKTGYTNQDVIDIAQYDPVAAKEIRESLAIKQAEQNQAFERVKYAREKGYPINPSDLKAAGLNFDEPNVPVEKPKSADKLSVDAEVKNRLLSDKASLEREISRLPNDSTSAESLDILNQELRKVNSQLGNEGVPTSVETPRERKEVTVLGNPDKMTVNPLYSTKDIAESQNASEASLRDLGLNRYKALEATANPSSFVENQTALNSMIKTLESNPKLAYKVTQPLGQQGGMLGGLLNVLEAGVGFNVSGVSGNINIPVSKAIVGSYDKEQRSYFDQLMQQAARVSQIQQKIANVNPGTIRNGEIDIYKQVSANPNQQGPNVMLYNLQYTKLNNEMLHEMFNKANKIASGSDAEFVTNPNSKKSMYDIMGSPAMNDISEKYKKKFEKLDNQFLKTLK